MADRRPYESPLRERQAEQTRNDILDALTTLLEDRRPDEITTKELASAAGVSERTVYRHFPDRLALVQGLSARFESKLGPGPQVLGDLDGLKPMVIALMGALEEHHVEARAEALLNTDPRRFSEPTRQNTVAFRELVGATLPDLDEAQRHAFAAVLRLLASAQAWLRMREEFDLPGDVSGPVLGWAIDALVGEVRRGNPPPSIPSRRGVR